MRQVIRLDDITGRKSVILDTNRDAWQLIGDRWYSADHGYSGGFMAIDMDFLGPFWILLDTTTP